MFGIGLAGDAPIVYPTREMFGITPTREMFAKTETKRGVEINVQIR
jgi:hypothetical protein